MARGAVAAGKRTGARPALLDGGWPEWIDPLAAADLRSTLRAGQVSHAYLLSGPTGVGKGQLAAVFAQAVCCTDPDAADVSRPCGRCRACRNVARGTHPDVETFSLETQRMLADRPGKGANLSIDTIRRLRSAAVLLPLEATRRILIVDDAETLLEPAQQALLKTLEEPPPAVTLFLLTDEPEGLLPTVRSRCRAITVRTVQESIVKLALQRHGVADELAAEIALLSRGCGDWARQAASNARLLQARRDEWESARSWVAAAPYERLVKAFRLGEQFGKRRADVIGTLQAAIQILRGEMLLAVGAIELTMGGEASARSSALALSRAISASLQCLQDLETNVRPRLALEAMVLTWPNSEAHRG